MGLNRITTEIVCPICKTVIVFQHSEGPASMATPKKWCKHAVGFRQNFSDIDVEFSENVKVDRKGDVM